MPPSAEAKQRHRASQRPKPDEWGFLGVLDDGTYPGTAEDGYIYAIPYRPGYTYARIRHGLSFEVAEVMAAGIPHLPNLQVGFQRISGVLVAMDPNMLSAVAGLGEDAGAAYVPPHTHDAAVLTYTPGTPADWDVEPETVQAALDELAGRTTTTEGMLFSVMMSAEGTPMVDADGFMMLRS